MQVTLIEAIQSIQQKIDNGQAMRFTIDMWPDFGSNGKDLVPTKLVIDVNIQDYPEGNTIFVKDDIGSFEETIIAIATGLNK